MFATTTYRQRRDRLKEQLKTGIILLPGNRESSMNYEHNYYPFRQDSSFLYFSGLDVPDLVLVMDIDNDQDILFGDDLTVEDIVWTGYRASVRDMADKAGIADTAPLKGIHDRIQKAVSLKQSIHYLPPYRPEHVLELSEWLGVSVKAVAAGVSEDLIKAVVAQRSVKSAEEVNEIEKAVNVTNAMQLLAMRNGRAGVSETALAGQLQGLAVSSGGNLSFPTILTVNGQILHNHYGLHVVRDGELLLCDCGAETKSHYAGDLTRTFPVSGKFSQQQKEIYDIVLASHEAAIAALQPGVFYRDVHLLACRTLAQGLKTLGLMKGDVDEAVKAGAHAAFFPCGLGHMLGLDTHDMENLGEAYVGYTDSVVKSSQFGLKSLRLGKQLEPGFVITVEPGLYFNHILFDEWEAAGLFKDFINYDQLKRYLGFGGVRVEEDVLITPDGCRILGEMLPKTAHDIEAEIGL